MMTIASNPAWAVKTGDITTKALFSSNPKNCSIQKQRDHLKIAAIAFAVSAVAIAALGVVAALFVSSPVGWVLFGLAIATSVAMIGASLVTGLAHRALSQSTPANKNTGSAKSSTPSGNARASNIQIFQATRQRSKTTFQHETNHLRVNARIIPFASFAYPAKNEKTLIKVEGKTTFEATRDLVNHGYNPLVLDMANAYSAGGGVRNGATAQEEHLCRQSNLFEGLEVLEVNKTIARGAFLPPTGGALLPKVVFHRDDKFNDLSKPVIADVFASAAYNCNRTSHGFDRPGSQMDYVNNTKEKIRTMFRTAISNGNDSLVLSAFGCGAFKNDPTVIANFYKEILAEEEFANQFKVVTFGIINDHNSSTNFQCFKKVF